MIDAVHLPAWVLETIGEDDVFLNAPAWFWDETEALPQATVIQSPHAVARCAWQWRRDDTAIAHQCAHVAGPDGLCAWHRQETQRLEKVPSMDFLDGGTCR